MQYWKISFVDVNISCVLSQTQVLTRIKASNLTPTLYSSNLDKEYIYKQIVEKETAQGLNLASSAAK